MTSGRRFRPHVIEEDDVADNRPADVPRGQAEPTQAVPPTASLRKQVDRGAIWTVGFSVTISGGYFAEGEYVDVLDEPSWGIGSVTG